MSSLPRVAARTLLGAARGEDPSLPPRRSTVSQSGLIPTPSQVRRYRRAVGIEPGNASDDGSPLPPLFITLWETPLLLALLGADGVRLPLGPIVHAESDRTLLRVIDPRKPCCAEATVEESSWGDADGGRMAVTTRISDDAGRLYAESRLRFRLPRGRSHGARPEVVGTGWRTVATGRVTARQARRYARLSGDWNPIHLSRLTAAPFGLRRPILHGSALEGWVAARLGTRGLLRLHLRFLHPLFLPARILLQTGKAAGIRVVLEGDGAVIATGSGRGAGSSS